MSPLITLLSDFGQQDWYVAAMKGRILQLAPQARLVDVTHAIPPQAVDSGAFVLTQLPAHFPEGTVHLAVVDPGVGSARRPLAARSGGQYFVGPDNGLLGRVAIEEVVALDPRRVVGERPLSATFHGRDLFAPAAALLAAQRALGELGDPVNNLVPAVSGHWFERDRIRARVLWIDRFGNVLTDIPRAALERLPGRPVVTAAGQRLVGLRHSYADAVPGEALLVVGSADTLEVAVREGNAARVLGLAIGDELTVEGIE